LIGNFLKFPFNSSIYGQILPVLVDARSKAQVYSRTPAEILVRIAPSAWMLWLLCVVQVEVSTTNWSLVQRSTADCGASPCVI